MKKVERQLRIKALAERSSYVENILRHGLVSSLAAVLWRRDPALSVQVFNSEVDDSGFDVVLGVGGEIRYVQLKQTHDEKVPPNCSVRLSFAQLPGACVVLVSHSMQDLRLTGYRFFGADPAMPLPDIEGFRKPRMPGRRSASGKQKIRENYRKIPIRHFKGPLTIEQLTDILFPNAITGQ